MELWDGYVQWVESDSVTQFMTVVGYIILSIPVLLYLIHLLDCVHRIAGDTHNMRRLQEDSVRLQESQYDKLYSLLDVLQDIRADQLSKDDGKPEEI